MPATSRFAALRSRLILTFALALLVALAAASSAGAAADPDGAGPFKCSSSFAFQTMLPSLFQGADGDQCDSTGLLTTANSYDWQDLVRDGAFNANGGGIRRIDDDGLAGSIYKDGSQEFSPNGWDYDANLGGKKTNLLAAWGHPDQLTDLYLYLAFAATDAPGTVRYGFEMNALAPVPVGQSAVNHPNYFKNSNNRWVLKRSLDDVLIVFNWQGGAAATIERCYWRPEAGANPPPIWQSGQWTDCVNLTTLAEAQGRGNGDGDNKTNDAITNFLPGLAANELVENQFGELAVNLTAALDVGGVNQDPCVSFGSFWMKTLPGNSMNSSLKDLIPPNPVAISNCGTVKIKKVTSPNPDPSTTSFDFAGAGFDTAVADGKQANSPTSFSLANGQTEEIINVEPNDQVGDPAYSITEQAEAGWALTGLTCTEDKTTNSTKSTATGVVGLKVEPGETIECTYTNTVKPASLTVVKDAAPNHAQDFGFSQSGLSGQTATFDLDDDADGTLQNTQTYANRSDFGTKLVTETPVSGWTLSNIACTGTAAVRYGQVSGGAFTGGPGGATFALGDTTVEVDLQPGKTASCTFLNVAAAASLSIVKNAAPDHAQDFTFDQTGLTDESASFDLDDDANSALQNTRTYGNRTDFGKKVISEDEVADWLLTTIACTGTAAVQYGIRDQNGVFTLDGETADFEQGDDAVEVDLQPGRTASCTFTNTADPASLEIVKNASPDHAQDFAFAQTGLTNETATFDLDDDANNTLQNTKAYGNRSDFGTKLVTETPAVWGWTLTGIACTGDAAARYGQLDSGNFVEGVNGAQFGQGDTTVEVVLEPGKSASCTFTNTAQASMFTVKKNAVPNHSQSFSFDGPDGGFELVDNGNLDDAKLDYSTSTSFGQKVFRELGESGWDLASIACTQPGDVEIGFWDGNQFLLGTPGGAADTAAYETDDNAVRVDVQPGESLGECTFRNDAQSSTFRVVKDAVPNHSQPFSFVGPNGGFELNDGGSLFASTTNFGPRVYREVGEEDWTLTDITCTQPGDAHIGFWDGNDFLLGQPGGGPDTAAYQTGDNAVRVDMQPGANRGQCTFTNTAAPASLTVVKDANPNHAQDFGFAQSGLSGAAAGFDLDDDADNTLSTTETYGNRTDFGKKVIREVGAANWSLSQIDCTGTAAVRIGKADADGQNFTVDGRTDGWEQGDNAVEADLQPGKSASCTFTNTAAPASLTVVKDAAPNHAQDFGFDQSGLTNEAATFDLDDDANNTLSNTKTYANRKDFGTKVISEDGGVANWSLTGIVCTGDAAVRIGTLDANDDFTLDAKTGDFDGGDTAVEVDLQPGKSASCTFTNTAAPASLSIVKDADPNHAQDFAFDQTGLANETATFDLDDDANNTLSDTKTYSNRNDFGTKVISEDGGPKGWTLQNIVCAGSADVRIGKLDANGAFTLDGKGTGFEDGDNAVEAELQPGRTASCTFTNTGRGTLVVEKQTAPDETSGATFGFTTAASGGAPSFSLADDGTDSRTLPPGAYTVTEGTKIGYRLTDVDCDDTDSTQTGDTQAVHDRRAAYAIEVGETVTCTFTNLKINASTIVVRSGNEFAYHGDDVTFSFDVTNPGNSPLHDAVVTDDRCTNVAGPVKQVDTGDPNELDPGDRWIYSCTMPVPAHTDGERNPFRNVVTVNAKDEQDQPVSSTADHLTRILHPAIAVDKTGPADGTAGLPVTYRIAVSNPGDVGFASDRVTVQDELCEAPPIPVADGKLRGDGADATPATLDPGDTWLYSCTVQTAIGQERVDNVVDVGGTDPNGRTVQASDTAGTLLRQPIQQVEPQRAQPGAARLQAPASCVTKPFKVVIRGRQIDAVTLFVRGKAVRTLRARQAVVLSATSKRVLVDGKVQTVRSAQSQQVFTFRVDPRQLRAGAVHRVSARVTFTTSSGTKTRRLKFAFQRCQAARKPRFTG